MAEETEVAPNWRELWAKSSPFHPLWKHSLDAAAVSLALQNPLASEGWSSGQAALVVGLHDFGKAEPVFQHQVPALSTQLMAVGFKPTADVRARHERISSAFFARVAPRFGLGSDMVATVCRAVRAHHGHWDSEVAGPRQPYFGAQDELFELLLTCLRVKSLPTSSDNHSALGVRIAGHIVLCDWIASNMGYFTDPRLAGVNEAVAYFEKSCAVADEWVRRLGLIREKAAGNPEGVVSRPREIQKLLLSLRPEPGLAIVEAPMGEGKTECAWILAELWRTFGFRGAYMALPTQATSDSLFARYKRDYLERLNREAVVHLVHGMAWLRDVATEDGPGELSSQFVVGDDEYDGDLAAQWFRPTRRAMLAGHGVGTIDQCLLAAMNAKFGFLRLYGLDGRVLIIDEVHAYDAYMSEILQRLLAWCSSLAIPVVLLSATLSKGQRAALVSAYGGRPELDPDGDQYPLVTIVQPDRRVAYFPSKASSSRSLKILPKHGLLGNAERTARLAEELLEKGGCVCVVVNTVKQAQRVYEALNVRQDEKLLFHARYTAEERMRRAEQVLALFGKERLARPARFILVATQVVEQSLDVDFDHMISELAPIDLLLQRSGRLHRHRRRENDPVLYVLLPQTDSEAFGPTSKVYSNFILRRTQQEVGSGLEANLPADFRMLIERVYGEGVPSVGQLVDERRQWEECKADLAHSAREFILRRPLTEEFDPIPNKPVGDDSDDGSGWRAKTRYGSFDVSCLFVPIGRIRKIRKGRMTLAETIVLYRGVVRIPHYIDLTNPAEPTMQPVEGEGKLRGLQLIPYENVREWRNSAYHMSYNEALGLLVDRLV